MFAKLFAQIFDSSIADNFQTRHVFMDLLVLADSDGVVDMTPDAIGRRTNVPIEQVQSALKDLCEPDPDSRTPLDDGRRLLPIDQRRSWGWQIVNYHHYRRIRDEEARRESWRDYKKREREAKRAKNGLKRSRKPKGDVMGPAEPCRHHLPSDAQIEAQGRLEGADLP